MSRVTIIDVLDSKKLDRRVCTVQKMAVGSTYVLLDDVGDVVASCRDEAVLREYAKSVGATEGQRR